MRRLAILAALQIGVLLGWAGYHERIRATAPTFRIPLAPRDPYDVLRGRYFVLNPRDSRLKTGEADTYLTDAMVRTFLRGEGDFHGAALIGFCPTNEVRRVCALQRPEHGTPRDGLWARSHVDIVDESSVFHDGKPVLQPGWHVTVDMDLDRFFLPEKLVLPGRESDTGWQLEVSYRPGLPLLAKRLWFQGQPVRIED